MQDQAKTGQAPLKSNQHRNEWLWQAGIALLLAVITFLHYATPTQSPYFHQIYQVLYFIPIVLAAVRYGLPGGLIVGLAATLLYLPHVLLQWGGVKLENLARFLMILLYNIVALVTGYLASREKREHALVEKAATELSRSYQLLKESMNQLAEAETELLHMDRLAVLGEMAAAVAHEIRNPLAAIRGAAEILAGDNVDDDVRHRFTSTILKEVDRLNRVVESYLGVARRRKLTLERTDLAETLRLVAQMVQMHAKRHNVTVRVSAPEKVGVLNIDHGGLRQVLLNLVLNAISVSPAGGIVELGWSREGNKHVITVSDQGPGLTGDQLRDIFKPFYTTRSDGTGLGLPIVKRIVQRAGWKLEIQSQPGKGATFKLILEDESGQSAVG